MKKKKIDISRSSLYLNWYLIFIPVLMVISCHKDVSETETIITTTVTTVSEYSLENGSVEGRVMDEQGLPVPNATVTLYSESQITDENGIYHFKDIPLNYHGSIIKVDKPGYYPGSDLVIAANDLAFSLIRLKAIKESGSFNSSAGGEISIDDKIELNFPPNAFITANNSLYNGSVDIHLYNNDINSTDFYDEITGGFYGENFDLRTSLLENYGAFDLAAYDEEGKKLDLAPNVLVNLKFKLNDPIISNYPNDITLWTFDQEKDIWIAKGKAIKNNEDYLGQLNSLSSWSFQSPKRFIRFCGEITFENEEVGSFLKVVALDDNVPTGSTYTNGQGEFCMLLPTNSELVFRIYNECDFLIEDTDVITKEEDVNEFAMKLDQKTITFTGNLYCDTESVNNGYIELSNNGVSVFGFTNELGQYNLSFSEQTCGSGEYTINAFGFATSNSAETVILSNVVSPVLLDFDICASCLFEAEIKESGNLSCDYSEDNLEVDITGGSGNYTYSWSNGSTDESIVVTEDGEYCVFITDVDEECDKMFCFDYLSKETLDINAEIENESCKNKDGILMIEPVGGIKPYTILVTSSNGYTGSGELHSDLSAGLYTIELVDANSCKITSEIEILSISNLEADFDGSYFCNGNGVLTVKPSGGVEPYTFKWCDGSETDEQEITEAGSYCVSITDANMCELFVYTEIDEIELEGEIIMSTNCDAGVILEVVLSNGNPSGEPIWSDGSQGYSITVGESGQYCVTVMDDKDCEVMICEEIFYTPLVASIDKEVICNGMGEFSVVIEEGIGPFDFLWDDGSTSQHITPTQSGDICVEVYDLNGCNIQLCDFVEIYEATISANCQQGDYVAILNPASSGTIINQSGGMFEEVIEGDFILTATFEYGNLCYGEESIFLPQFEGLEINSVNDANCQGCEGGYIDFTIDYQADCFGCQLAMNDEVKIFKQDDYDTNLIELNAEQSLEAGIYYVIVYDESGCVIATSGQLLIE